MRVVDGGSFAAAAAASGVSATMVAKQIRAIEDRIGARLIHRTTRRHQLTEVGQLYLERCRAALTGVALAEASAHELQREPRGAVRLVAPVGFGTRAIAPALVRYLAAHANVTVDLALDDRPEERVRQGHELGVVIGDLRDEGLVARPLQPYRRILAAAPAYLGLRHAATSPRAGRARLPGPDLLAPPRSLASRWARRRGLRRFGDRQVHRRPRRCLAPCRDRGGRHRASTRGRPGRRPRGRDAEAGAAGVVVPADARASRLCARSATDGQAAQRHRLHRRSFRNP